MRAALLVLSLCGGTVVFAQTNPAKPANSFKLELTQPAADASNYRAFLHGSNTELWKAFAIPGTRAFQQRNNAQIDPGFILHPPNSSVGVQPPGIPIEQDLYPGLRLLPIDESKARLQALTK
jgi:hypothetical protein